MAIQITNISKRKNGTYRVSVQDTEDQTGTDEKGNPVYRTYSVVHNPNNSADFLKEEIIKKIAEKKKLAEEEATIESAIKTSVESIDTAKISTASKE